MTAQILTTELSNLISESKRKNRELHNAAEKTLEDLKALRISTEVQLAADLSIRPHFVTPFIIATATKNVKFVGIAIVCLQRLVAASALPKSRLNEVVDAFREAAASTFDVQLKVLQSLPALFSNYADVLYGDLLAAALNVCTILQSSKNSIVNNTAAATLQQLVVTVFDKVTSEDRAALSIPTTAEVPGDGAPLQIRAAAYDAYRVFNDLCLLIEHQQPEFLKVNTLQQTFGLELIESVLTNHVSIFLSHEEQGSILRRRVMPFIVSSLSEKRPFGETVRIIRIFFTLIREYLSILASEAEMALGLLIHMLDTDTAAWKRALCMEVMKGVFSDGSLVRRVFGLYDAHDGRTDILTKVMAAFVRLSNEKPILLGVGAQSTTPTRRRTSTGVDSTDQAMLEATGVPGIISNPQSSGQAGVGIDTNWSTMRVPCIDQLDKSDPPTIPETYIYNLVLVCISGLAEGLAKFILPLTVPKRGYSGATGEDQVTQRHQDMASNSVPINPLVLEGHALHGEVEVCAAIVERCWPAVLATCSTFFHAALDTESYRALVRSFQKLTHVAGLLRLSTPRDTFLTALGKASVPPGVLGSTSSRLVQSNPSGGSAQRISDGTQASITSDNDIVASPEKRRSTSTTNSTSLLNTRNMLCLRALINLGIALGPTLEQAWFIVLECLQQADLVLSFSATGRKRSSVAINAMNVRTDNPVADDPTLLANFGAEIRAVDAAITRLFNSTLAFPDEPFCDIVSALCKLLNSDDASTITSPTSSTPASPTLARMDLRRPVRTSSSISAAQDQEGLFALAKISEIASLNLERLLLSPPGSSGWSILMTELTSTVACVSNGTMRTRAAHVLVKIIAELADATRTLSGNDRSSSQWRLLDTFKRTLDALSIQSETSSIASNSTEVEIHKIVLEGLKDMLESSGELTSGWNIVFDIIGSVFVLEPNALISSAGLSASRHHISRSPKLVKSAFNSLQLICSDFLTSIPNDCFPILIDTLYDFCVQEDDINICLTAVTIFWVISDYTVSNSEEDFEIEAVVIRSVHEQHQAGCSMISIEGVETNGARWILLLLRLAAVMLDERIELRHSAIQTLLRILDAVGDYLSAEAWLMCLQSVIYRGFASIETRLTGQFAMNVSQTHQDDNNWVETAILLLKGVSHLLSSYIHTLTSNASFAISWETLLQHFTALLQYQDLHLRTAVFEALRVVLVQVKKSDGMSANLARPSQALVWNLWSENQPVSETMKDALHSPNQACLLAYISLLHQVQRILKDDIDLVRTQRILELLRTTIQQATAEAYATDIEHPTALQSQVLDSLNDISTEILGVSSAMLIFAADLVTMAYRGRENDLSTTRGLTYVALSKAAMSLIQTLVLAHGKSKSTQISAVNYALQALLMAIELKYSFRIVPRSTAPWRLATSTSLNILPTVLDRVSHADVPTVERDEIWKTIVITASAIVAGTSIQTIRTPNAVADESFDIESFRSLRDMILPELGNVLVQDEARVRYAEAVFNSSLVYEAVPGDIPAIGEDMMICLKKMRKGRTIDSAPNMRRKMSYVCIQELFSLTSIRACTTTAGDAKAMDESLSQAAQYARLAQAAAPYLLLRCGISLKTYIANQPLRGCCPQPLLEKNELCFLLENLISLRCFEDAIVGDDVVESGEQKHLLRLYPLLVRAIGVDRARGGEKVQGLIKKALDVAGGCFVGT